MRVGCVCDEQHGFEAAKSVRKSLSPGALVIRPGQIWLLLELVYR